MNRTTARTAPLLLAILGAWATAAPPEVPPEVKARPGRIATIDAKCDCKLVRWAMADDKADADLIPLQADGKRVLFSSPAAGRYQLLCWSCDDGGPTEAARVVVVVGDPPPPTPPTPPQPADPLAAEFQSLFAADATPGKAQHVKQLAALYTVAAGFASSDAVATTDELIARVQAAAKGPPPLYPPDAIVPLRTRASAAVRDAMGEASRPLTPELRTAAAAVYARVGKALEGVR